MCVARHFLLSVLLSAGLMLGMDAGAQTYRLTDLSAMFPQASNDGITMNNAGEFIGSGYDPTLSGPDARYAFVHRKGVTTRLTPGGGLYIHNGWLTDAGDAYGVSYAYDEARQRAISHRAYAYRGGAFIDVGGVPPLDGKRSYANGMNIHGQLVGYYLEDNTAKAFIYSRGVVQVFASPTGRNMWAEDINTQGHIAGSYLAAHGYLHGYVYSNGAFKDLGSLNPSKDYQDYSAVYAINDVGEVVGYSVVSGIDGHAFLYSNGVMKDLGTLGGVESYALDLNQSGVVVGRSKISPTSVEQHAFVYADGKMTDLNAAIDRADPLAPYVVLSMAYRVLDDGRIVVAGNDVRSRSSEVRSYLLTPTPPPAPPTPTPPPSPPPSPSPGPAPTPAPTPPPATPPPPPPPSPPPDGAASPPSTQTATPASGGATSPGTSSTPSVAQNSGSSGGGALDWLTILLSALVFMERRRSVHRSQVA